MTLPWWKKEKTNFSLDQVIPLDNTSSILPAVTKQRPCSADCRAANQAETPPVELKILLIDDSEADRIRISRWLRRELVNPLELFEAEDAQSALEFLQEKQVDLVLLDYFLPDMDGLDVLRKITDSGQVLGTIFLAGQGNERVAAEAIKRGALDYVIKQHLVGGGLHPAVREAIRTVVLRKTHRHNAPTYNSVQTLALDLQVHLERIGNALELLHQKTTGNPCPILGGKMTQAEDSLLEARRLTEHLRTQLQWTTSLEAAAPIEGNVAKSVEKIIDAGEISGPPKPNLGIKSRESYRKNL